MRYKWFIHKIVPVDNFNVLAFPPCSGRENAIYLSSAIRPPMLDGGNLLETLLKIMLAPAGGMLIFTLLRHQPTRRFSNVYVYRQHPHGQPQRGWPACDPLRQAQK